MANYRLRDDATPKAMWKLVAAISLGAMIVAAGVYYISRTSRTPHNTQHVTRVAKPEAVQLESKVLFMGDTYWGRYMNEWSQASPQKNAYPFSGLASFERTTYNAWVANLECPTVPNKVITPSVEDATLLFNCSPEYLNEAKKWFTAFSLANNHTDNQGTAGFVETQKQLKAHDIAHFGHYDPEVHDQLCTVIAVDTNTSDKLPLALCGYHGVFKIPSDASIAVIKQYAQYMPVIAMPHMGVEYKTSADPIRETTYHKMIDAGADAVIAAHPHWVQNSEAYKGKPIFYSIGNFIFDQQANKEVTRSAPVSVTFSGTVKTKQAHVWSNLLSACTQQQTCITDAAAQKLTRPTISLTYDIVPGDSSRKLTKRAAPDVAATVLERLKWAETKTQLTPSPTAQ